MPFLKALAGIADVGVNAFGEKLDPFYIPRKIFHIACFGLFIVSIIMMISWAWGGFTDSKLIFAALIMAAIPGCALFIEHHFFPSMAKQISQGLHTAASVGDAVIAARQERPYVQPDSAAPAYLPPPAPVYQQPFHPAPQVTAPPFNGAVGGGSEGGMIPFVASAVTAVGQKAINYATDAVNELNRANNDVHEIADHYKIAAQDTAEEREMYNRDKPRIAEAEGLLDDANDKLWYVRKGLNMLSNKSSEPTEVVQAPIDVAES